jgi:nitrogen-specific signal transduction histidine kinase
MKDKMFAKLITGKAKSTGGRLAEAKRIMDAHGGTVTFESYPGKAPFVLTLPIMPTDAHRERNPGVIIRLPIQHPQGSSS